MTRLAALTNKNHRMALTLSVLWAVGATGAALLFAVLFFHQSNIRHTVIEEYETRLNDMEAERDGFSDQVDVLTDRLSESDAYIVSLLDQIRSTTARITAQEADITALNAALTARDATLAQLYAELDQSITGRQIARSDLTTATERSEMLEQTITLLSAELTALATTRDAQDRVLEDLTETLLSTQRAFQLSQEQQLRVYERLETALSAGREQLESVFLRSGLDTDAILDTMAAQRGVLLDANLSPDTSRLEAILQDHAELMLLREAVENLPYGAPVLSAYRFTSGFGMRRHPITGQLRPHNGHDYAAGSGTPIYAAGQGRISFAGWMSGYGHTVRIDHGFGHQTLYAHLRRITVSVGDRVDRQDQVGEMGSSGLSTGTHLHYEIHRGGTPLDPTRYLEAARHVL